MNDCKPVKYRKPKEEMTVAERAKKWPVRLTTNTRVPVVTAAVILYSKGSNPVVIAKHPTKKNKYVVEGL